MAHKFEIYKDKAGEFRVRFKFNSEVMFASGGGEWSIPIRVAEPAPRHPLDPLTADWFPALLEARAPQRLEVPSADVLVPGRAEGPLVGGCLSLLAALAGTPWEYDFRGALLFIEEVGEEAYRVDRMLGTLLSTGRLDGLAGIMAGSMTRVTFGGVEDPERLRRLLLDRFAPLGVPVAIGLPFGHAGPNVPLPVGARAAWDGGTRTLVLEEEFLS